MLNELKRNAALTHTENGALTNRTSGSDCLDLFFRAGAMRNASEEEIRTVFMRAYAEDALTARKLLFYIRDVRGGLGERRFFRTAAAWLAAHDPDALRRNVRLFAEYGRYDDLLLLLGTACEDEAVSVIREQLSQDTAAMAEGKPVSLLAKWLPSVNTSSAAARAAGRVLAKKLDMSEKAYRKTLAALRRYVDIVENRLREKDYTFDYAKVPSRAMFQYRHAFARNDEERYTEYLADVESGETTIHAATLYPYDIVRRCLELWQPYRYSNVATMDATERRSLDALWNALPAYGEDNGNAIAVVDGSGSMYRGMTLRPIDVAISLGIYFAEHTRGEFAGHFITFSCRPQLVEVKGTDIFEKTAYCARYNEVANTDLEAVFDLILRTALEHHMEQSELPARLYIISDMEFDNCVDGGDDETLYETMKRRYAEHGYQLPQVVFWNVNSQQENNPVRMTETGAALVSGATPAIFDMVAGGDVSPMAVMRRVIESARYASVE